MIESDRKSDKSCSLLRLCNGRGVMKRYDGIRSFQMPILL